MTITLCKIVIFVALIDGYFSYGISVQNVKENKFEGRRITIPKYANKRMYQDKRLSSILEVEDYDFGGSGHNHNTASLLQKIDFDEPNESSSRKKRQNFNTNSTATPSTEMSTETNTSEDSLSTSTSPPFGLPTITTSGQPNASASTETSPSSTTSESTSDESSASSSPSTSDPSSTSASTSESTTDESTTITSTSTFSRTSTTASESTSNEVSTSSNVYLIPGASSERPNNGFTLGVTSTSREPPTTTTMVLQNNGFERYYGNRWSKIMYPSEQQYYWYQAKLECEAQHYGARLYVISDDDDAEWLANKLYWFAKDNGKAHFWIGLVFEPSYNKPIWVNGYDATYACRRFQRCAPTCTVPTKYLNVGYVENESETTFIIHSKRTIDQAEAFICQFISWASNG